MWSVKITITITIISLLSTFSQAVPKEDIIQIMKTTLTPTAKSAHPDANPILTPFSNLNLTALSLSTGLLPKVLPQRRGIVGGVDNKKLWVSRDFPYRTMGRIIASSTDDQGKEKSWLCSGTLVGPRHVVTVAHCLAASANKDGKWPVYRFFANYNKGTSLANSTSIAQYRSDWKEDNECSKVNDMGVIVLADRIGDQVGWMGLEEFDVQEVHKSVFSAFGYPGGNHTNGELPMLQEGVTVNQTKCENKAVMADVDWVGGMSGGALFKKEGIQYGVMSRWIWEPVVTGVWYAGGKPLVGLVNLVRSEYP